MEKEIDKYVLHELLHGVYILQTTALAVQEPLDLLPKDVAESLAPAFADILYTLNRLYQKIGELEK